MNSKSIPNIYYPINVTKLIDENISRSIEEQLSCVFFVVEFVNLGNIIAIKGGEQTAILLYNLCEYLYNNHITCAIPLNHDRLLIIQLGLLEDQLEFFTSRLFSLLHQYSYERNDGSIYLQPMISFTTLNHNNCIADVILDECFVALNALRNKRLQSICQFDHLLVQQSPTADEMKEVNYFYKKMIAKELVMHLQPVIYAKNKRMNYYECLLRIKENGALVSAGKYIQLAEKYGFINEVDVAVIDQVIELIKNNQNDIYSINLSSLCLEDKRVVNYLLKAIDKINCSERLVVEITETAIFGNVKTAKEFISELKKRNCKVALDDYGSGYTSLKNLKELSIDILKIDGYFIKNLETDPISIIYVKNIIELCKSLDLKVVAEFVSNKKISDILIKLGVDCLQGYYIDRLMSK